MILKQHMDWFSCLIIDSSIWLLPGTWSPLVCRGPWMSTVVLYCWCHSDSASVPLYFTLWFYAAVTRIYIYILALIPMIKPVHIEMLYQYCLSRHNCVTGKGRRYEPVLFSQRINKTSNGSKVKSRKYIGVFEVQRLGNRKGLVVTSRAYENLRWDRTRLPAGIRVRPRAPSQILPWKPLVIL